MLLRFVNARDKAEFEDQRRKGFMRLGFSRCRMEGVMQIARPPGPDG